MRLIEVVKQQLHISPSATATKTTRVPLPQSSLAHVSPKLKSQPHPIKTYLHKHLHNTSQRSNQQDLQTRFPSWLNGYGARRT